MTANPSNPRKNLKTGLVFLAAGLVLAAVGGYFLSQDLAISSWKTASGKILSSAVSKSYNVSGGGSHGKTTERASVEYEYTVNGRTYKGFRIQSTPITNPLSNPYKIVGRYPPGKAVQVFYDPADPGSSVLVKGVGFGAILFLSFSGFALLAAFGALKRVWRNSVR